MIQSGRSGNGWCCGGWEEAVEVYVRFDDELLDD